MELRQCRYFIAVVDAESISSAARRLHVVQSAVSHQIANLEAELQTTLLLRTKHGVKPTEAGRLMYMHAMAMIKHAEAARDRIKALDAEVKGTVAIGLPNSVAGVLALPILKTMRARFPLVELRMIEGLGPQLAEQLGTGKLDLSVLFDAEPRSGFERIPLLKEQLHFVTADPAALRQLHGARSVPLKDVAKWPLVLPPMPNSIRLIVEHAAQKADIRLNIVGEVSSVKIMLDAVLAQVASTVMMAANAAALPPGVQAVVLPIRQPVMHRTASLFLSEHFPVTPAIESVRDTIVELIRDFLAAGDWPGGSAA